MLYRVLTVGGVDYKLKLTTKQTIELEKKLGGSPVNGLINTAKGQVPSATYVATCLHGCMQQLNKNITMDKVYEIMDKAAEEGKGPLELVDLLTDVYQDACLIPRDDPKEEEKEEEETEQEQQEEQEETK